MAHTIPMIRSAGLFPLLHWLRANGRSVPAHLDAAGLGFLAPDRPEVPVPLVSMLALFGMMGKAEGPDIAARAIAASSFAEMGALGQIVLGAPTPRIAIERVICALPLYSTHELLALTPAAGGARLEAGWSLVMPEEIMPLTQQYTAALVTKACAAAEGGSRLRISIAPDPVLGVAHLRPWLGDDLVARPGPQLAVDIDDATLDAPLLLAGAAAGAMPAWESLLGDGSIGHSVRLLVAAMAGDPPVTMARIADAAAMSTRSLQRALHAEGTSFRAIVDAVRREQALRRLPAANGPLSRVAHDTGYAAQSSLSRAVRRWTGVPPLALRAAAGRE